MKPWMRLTASTLSWSLMAGCATSPVEHFHTLRPLPSVLTLPSIASAEVPTVSVAATVAASADRPQWLVRTGPTQVQILEQQRWIQPLSQDIAEAVAVHLNQTHRIAANPESAELSLPFSIKTRISVQLAVIRFETLLAPVPGIHDEMKWAVKCNMGVGQNATHGQREGALTVSRQISVPESPTVGKGTSPTFDHLATAHANALAEASRAIATAVSDVGTSCSRH